MDEKPFLTLDLEDIDEHIVPEVLKLTKTSFDVDSVVDAAGELKYLSQIKKLLAEQFGSPEEDFVKFFANSTSKCDTRLCRLTVLFEYLDRLPESETFPRS